MASKNLAHGMGTFLKDCEHPSSRWSKCPHEYKIRYRNAAGKQVTTLHEAQRETELDKRRGHRPRAKGDGGTGRRPILTLADRLLAALLHYRLGLPQVTVAALFRVRPETINKRIRDIRCLLEQASHTIQPAEQRLTTLDDLYAREHRRHLPPSRDQGSESMLCEPQLPGLGPRPRIMSGFGLVGRRGPCSRRHSRYGRC
ncbi:transposase family protein [Streptomyces sp. NBC_01262]|nr:transposase family protein [Streptomyces sp. NBC_01262]